MAKSKAEKKKKGREAREARRKAEQRQKLISRSLWIGLPILFIVSLITWGVINQNNQPPFDPLLNLRDSNVSGNLAAPVTIVEFGDFG